GGAVLCVSRGYRASSCTVAYLYVSGLGRIGLILCGVNVLPLTALNPSANLRGRSSLARLFVRVQCLAHADVTHRSVGACEAIKQAAVTVRAVTMAIARLLVQHFLYFCRER